MAELGAALAQDSSERRLTRKDGSTIWCAFSGSWLLDEQARPLYTVTIVQDITAHKHSERAVRELSGRLLSLQDEERRRIARELHESPAQNLAALAVNLAIIQKSATLEGRAKAALEESIRLIEECSREIRTLSHLLHPPLLEEIGLSAALRWYVDGFARRSGVDVSLDVAPELGRLSHELETTLFRVVQEALTNIHRHSGSPSAAISLEEEDGNVVLAIVDRGRGMPPVQEEGASVGVGIAGMRERVRQLSGQLDIDSGPDGTRVRVALPLKVTP
jgi:signal transduction histidine kinase